MATVEQALAKKGETLKSLDVWKETMPTEAEMLPKDKYTMFDRKEKRYRKGIHSRFFILRGVGGLVEDFPTAYGMGGVDMLIPWFAFFAELPKWTRVSQRVNPPGY